MPDPRQLPFLLELLEDESPLVRDAVRKELARYGPNLKLELSRLPQPLPAERLRTVAELLEDHNRDWLRAHWPQWRDEPDEQSRLEQAFRLLADFQNGPALHDPLGPRLDALAAECRGWAEHPHPSLLAQFLFQNKKLQGAREHYYSPAHSNLSAVLRRRRGLPISLCCIYILVGGRLGLSIEGCNFPGHFLARFRAPNAQNGSFVYVDCFDGGRLLDARVIHGAFRNPAPGLLALLEQPARAEAIIARVLRNLIFAYGKSDQPGNASLLAELLETLPGG